jgi:hypothetical protein
VKVRTEDLFRGEPMTVVPVSRHPEDNEKELVQ